MPFDPDSATGKARLAAIHKRHLALEQHRPPAVRSAPLPTPTTAGPAGYRPAPQEAPVPDQSTDARRPLPTGSTKTTLGRLLFRSRNGAPEDRAAARAELERRRSAAGTTGGAA